MIVKREGNQIIIRGVSVVDVNINIIDVVVTQWEDDSVGIFNNKTNATYRAYYGDITNESVTPLGTSKTEVVQALNVMLSDSGGGTAVGTSGSLPKPFITDVIGEALAPNKTGSLEIKGGYFTENTTVEIEGQTVNDVKVLDDDTITLSVITGTEVGEFDVVVNNGLETLRTDAYKVYSIVTIQPLQNEWVRVRNVQLGDGWLVPATISSGWNAGASFGEVPENKDFELTFDLNYMSGQTSGGYVMVGVDELDPNFNYNTIDYAFYFSNGNSLMIYENGSSRGNQGNFNINDTFMLKRVNGVITYYKNGNLVYTSTVVKNTKMVFDISIYRSLGVKNVKLKFKN